MHFFCYENRSHREAWAAWQGEVGLLGRGKVYFFPSCGVDKITPPKLLFAFLRGASILAPVQTVLKIRTAASGKQYYILYIALRYRRGRSLIIIEGEIQCCAKTSISVCQVELSSSPAHCSAGSHDTSLAQVLHGWGSLGESCSFCQGQCRERKS